MSTTPPVEIIWHDATDITPDQTIMQWAIDELVPRQGRPTLPFGQSGSGKTTAVMTAAMQAAIGVPVFGRFTVSKPLRVRWLDFEMGTADTRRLAHRVQNALSEPLPRGAFQYTTFPPFKFSDKNAKDITRGIAHGCDLVIVDPFRAATDDRENDSEVRRGLDIMSYASEMEGAHFIVLHHAGHDASKLRGSTAIEDGSGYTYQFSRANSSGLRTVKRKKPDAPFAPFALRFEDVTVNGDPKGGLLVVHVPLAPGDVVSVDANARARIAELVREHPGSSQRELEKLHGGKNTTTRQLLREVVKLGDIKIDGGRFYPANSNSNGRAVA